MIWLIIGIVCFLLFKNFLSKLEVDSRNGWNPVKLPLWGWIIAAAVCLFPGINIIAFIVVVIFAIIDIRSSDPELRFKEDHWINKLIDFMNRKY